MRIESIDQAHAAIWRRSGYDRGFISNPFAGDEEARRGLRRTSAMLERLGNPQHSVPLVHVAGSKGKGSTCVLIDAIARASGLRTGRFLSPHLHRYNERFVVEDRPIDDHDFVSLTRDAVTTAEAAEREDMALGAVTAWELSTAMALTWFARSGCELAIVEVGMGGTLDATNVIEPVVSVITRLDLEHTAALGDSMAEIAANKAGIIKPGTPVVVADNDDEALAVVTQRARDAHAPLMIGGRDFSTSGTHRSFAFASPRHDLRDLTLGLVGRHQVENAALAIQTAILLGERFPAIDERAIRHGLRSVWLAGRFERFDLDDGTIMVVDGAHTPLAADALATAIDEEFPGVPAVVVLGMLAGKNVAQIIQPLARVAARWIATAPGNPRALPVADLRAALEAEEQQVVNAPTVDAAIARARTGCERLIVVSGSLATAAEARLVFLNLNSSR